MAKTREIEMVSSQSASAPLLKAARPVERRFGISFNCFCKFEKVYLRQLHAQPLRQLAIRPSIAVLSHRGLLTCYRTLRNVANMAAPTLSDRSRYLKSLLHIYKHLPVPHSARQDVRAVCVAPRREGALLAGLLGWRNDLTYSPHLKRIPFQHGLVVGIAGTLPTTMISQVDIVDGAIASGCTVIAVIESLRRYTRRFHIYSAHGAAEGIAAIDRYCQEHRIRTSISIGRVTVGVDRHYYAVSARNARRLEVGDVGDILEPLVADLTSCFSTRS
jgi:hypothetical protein